MGNISPVRALESAIADVVGKSRGVVLKKIRQAVVVSDRHHRRNHGLAHIPTLPARRADRLPRAVARHAYLVSMTVERCARCGAAVRQGQSWCTLCHAALGEEPSGVAESSPTAVDATAVSPAEPTEVRPSEPGAPADADGDALADSVPDLSLLSLTTGHEGWRPWASRLDSNGAKLAVMFGGMVVVMIVLVGIMAVIGLFLR